MKTVLLAVSITLITGCAASPAEHEPPQQPPPHLWSGHKQLGIGVEACAFKGYSALKSLGFTSMVQNGNYNYGNFHSARGIVKCVALGSDSFVYIAVAGPDKDVVERLRNELAWSM